MACKNIAFSITLCLTAVFTSVTVATVPDIGPTRTWSGKIRQKALQKRAPKAGYINDAATLSQLWTAWRPGKKLPTVDFSKKMILVGTVPGPNLVIMRPSINDSGDVKFSVAGTKMGGPGFGYKLVVINSNGVIKVNGKKVVTPAQRSSNRAQELKAAVKSFQLHLTFTGESDKPYYDLLLSVPEFAFRRDNPFSLQGNITTTQAIKIIDYLKAENMLDQADITGGLKKQPQPFYFLRLQAGKTYFSKQLHWDISMLQHFEGIHSLLDGNAAKSMKTLIARLSGHRREWTAAKTASIKDSVTVKVVGKLRTGLMAIGAETTGTTITANGITWELELGKQTTFRKEAQQLDGKQVIVHGRLERKQGVEIQERWIVTVTSLGTLDK